MLRLHIRRCVHSEDQSLGIHSFFFLPTRAFAAMLSLTASLLLIGGFFQGVVSTARILPRDGRFPALPYADDTTKYCVWWLDYESVGSCVDMLEANYINLEEFRRWVRTPQPLCACKRADKTYRTLL